MPFLGLTVPTTFCHLSNFVLTQVPALHCTVGFPSRFLLHFGYTVCYLPSIYGVHLPHSFYFAFTIRYDHSDRPRSLDEFCSHFCIPHVCISHTIDRFPFGDPQSISFGTFIRCPRYVVDFDFVRLRWSIHTYKFADLIVDSLVVIRSLTIPHHSFIPDLDTFDRFHFIVKFRWVPRCSLTARTDTHSEHCHGLRRVACLRDALT